MPNSNGKNMTWKQWGVILKQWGIMLSMVVLLLIGFGVFNTKADKKMVDDVEARCVCRINEIKEELKETCQKFDKKQDKIIDLLIQMNPECPPCLDRKGIEGW